MRIVKYSNELLEDITEIVAKVILEEGCAVIPTDTCYGLAADALSSKAVEKVFRIKKRELNKVVSVFVDSIDMIRDLCIVDRKVEKFLRLLPERVTLILKARRPEVFPRGIVTPDGKIGIRLPHHPLPPLIVKRIGRPITATSANISGFPPIYDSSKILTSLRGFDLLVDAGILPRIPPSTVVDLTCRPPRVLRRGPLNIDVLK